MYFYFIAEIRGFDYINMNHFKFIKKVNLILFIFPKFKTFIKDIITMQMQVNTSKSFWWIYGDENKYKFTHI